MFIYNDRGEMENGQVLLQMKATDNLRLLKDAKTISFSLDRHDLRLWLRQCDPVILIVYDGTRDIAYWLYVQRYFDASRPIDLFTGPGRVTVHLPTANRVNRRAISQFAKFCVNVQKQLSGKVRHGD